MTNKEKYIEFVKDKLIGKAQELVINQIKLYYEDINIDTTKYSIGEEVKLPKGTFLHGLGGNPNAFEYVLENGIIGRTFNGNPLEKINYSVGVWKIQNDCLLKDYIHDYSGVTIRYYVGRGPGCVEHFDMAGFGEVEDKFIELNNTSEIWDWCADQTKEVRFMPSLCSDKIQYAFIFNMESEYAKKMAYADAWNFELGEETCKQFFSPNFFEQIWSQPRNPLTTDRESAVMFGLPSRLIEGVLVGRNVENDISTLNYIKSKLPNCYICNLDGQVIVANK